MSLPSLRADLQLSQASASLDGSPRWTLADPVRGRYFKLSIAAIRLLRHWSLGDAEQVLQAANREPGLPLGATELDELLVFLRAHDLIGALDPQQRASYAYKAAAQRRGMWQMLLHQYLFFRIPLWRPDAFLNWAWPWLERFGPRLLRYGSPATLGLGVFLVSRDWQRFISTFPHLFSLGGALSFGTALFFAKLFHEFGHAFMAKRAGCRVQSMGVAFMVMLPMFYTDVSDAWRVNDRRARLLIGAGGVMAEMLLACIALLAWSLLPDGPARTAAFMLASATWLTTLAVNLNPFMRFDGYFLLSDLWEVDNLQGRAFALCRWRLGEVLFGYGQQAPEPWSPTMQRRLLWWGYLSWLWRAALFFGIALAVYHLFFKLLGIFLMQVELVWFIFLPIFKEGREWWSRREQAQFLRAVLSALVLLGLVLLLIVPWRSAVELPVMLEAGRVTALHAPVAARVKQVNVQDGQTVAQGMVLIELESPDVESRQTIVRQEIDILQLQMRRQASHSETAADVGILEQRLAESVAEYRGLTARRERLLLRAPQAGQVRDLMPQLTVGRWVSTKEPLARVVESGARLRGYLAEDDLWRVAPGATGRFIADDPMRPALAVELVDVDANGVAFIDQEALTSDHHGPIAVRRDENHRPEPVQAQYGVHLKLIEASIDPSQPLRGVVVLQGLRESLLGTVWRRMAALGVRESGF
ncbi:HlyD family efflux transporter periplasmic adaptor subunit [Pseudomonas sp. 10B1]|uniref:HlyD family efflux transporter periplasmic adaptor subunit n=1 Tax=unclassified Pseudomonas TaxID=196821 RepID=UPI002AB47086|nr:MULTISPECIES: HlyD family efflux transporter periplasmic adaptor subunit [unclassified Pseudomonas]MDY7562736.1 HlyD family efflux transporter periplasmic adaptor subunit [Pseudomonas sp. AB6]MEA9977400.1 HlyD family efflux transporter periplasmic adaptor subunit [Pseudomonas sp. RTS4]MEA9996927.1 HlyD family efflux transporter periplasmic adaptor subunit [Pseudomonas sp. AA4]MEB0089152.1 HlyD family efflux transporter periplasmic adaptor subunit [Pseudomonas sp. RTI1]MEB0128344.1 HlyD fami